MPPRYRLIAPLAVALVGIIGSGLSTADEPNRSLDSAISGAHRSEAHKILDQSLKPRETIVYFGIKSNDKVIEIWPKEGWLTEILAPYLAEDGRLITAVEPANTPERTQRRSRYLDKLANDPEVYGEATVVTFDPPNSDIRPVGGVDTVVSAFNFPAWQKTGVTDSALAAIYRALKSGGTLGIIESTNGSTSAQPDAVDEKRVVERALAAGFVLTARSTSASPDTGARHSALRFAKPGDAPTPDDVVRSVRSGY